MHHYCHLDILLQLVNLIQDLKMGLMIIYISIYCLFIKNFITFIIIDDYCHFIKLVDFKLNQFITFLINY
jgi:hypothetical protein